MKPVVTRAPGKLMLMGEYAVTQVGHPGIATAIDRFLTCAIEPAANYVLQFPGMGTPLVRAERLVSLQQRLNRDARLDLAHHALNIVEQYLREEGRTLSPFHLTITSELQTASGTKYGFGSSAAASVAIVAGLLRYATSIDPGLDATFKLASAAHVLAQGDGSCADIAAITYGGIVHYERFDASWLRHRLTSGDGFHNLVQKEWPMLRIQPLPKGPDVFLRVGWTGTPVSTPKFLQHMTAFKKRSPGIFRRFLVESDRSVRTFVEAMRSENRDGLFQAIDDNRAALRMLADQANFPIETHAVRKALETVKQLGGTGKSSGSGGGDAIVAWFAQEGEAETLKSRWRTDGIELVPTSPIPQGLTYDM